MNIPIPEWEWGPLQKFRLEYNGRTSSTWMIVVVLPFTRNRASVQLQLLVFDEP